jgi:hypothetical protein
MLSLSVSKNTVDERSIVDYDNFIVCAEIEKKEICASLTVV